MAFCEPIINECMQRGVLNLTTKSFLKTVRRKFTNTPPTPQQQMYADEVRQGKERADERRKRKAKFDGMVAFNGVKRLIPRKKGKLSGESPPFGERKTAE